MSNDKVYPYGALHKLQEVFFRLAASGLIPPDKFRAALPPEKDRKPSPEFPAIEIVSHCWQYSTMLAYQLSSLVNYPPSKLSVLVTVFYSETDKATVELLEFIGTHRVDNLTWNWQPLPEAQLFRRSIGRNRAALATRADWVWMTDCDIVFHKGCLDSLAQELRGKTDALVFPAEVQITDLLPDCSPMLRKDTGLELKEIDTQQFRPHRRDRAKGPFQIVHGDVARTIGYCDRIALYQTPAAYWCKCYEDRAFRWLVGTQGTPVNIINACQIRHIEKGRYRQKSLWSRLRGKIRRMQETK